MTVMKYATAAPDEVHPYGHAKFETLAAFAIAGFLFGVCYQEMHLHNSNEFGRDHIASHAIIDEVERRLEGGIRKSHGGYPRRTIAVGLKELFVIHSPEQTENDNPSKNYGNRETACRG
jgi:hypothetical protein